jgi:glycosyltransferase family protein
MVVVVGFLVRNNIIMHSFDFIKRFLRPFRPILLPVKYFLTNIIYLFKHSIADDKISGNTLNYYLDNIKFEIAEDLENLRRPSILNPYNTLDTILQNGKSVTRFGDGEFELLLGRSIEFQNYDPLLAKRLSEIIRNSDDNIIVCIPHYFWYSVNNCNLHVKEYARKIVSRRRTLYEEFLLDGKLYYATEFTQLYMTYKQNIDLSQYFESLISIWKNQDITIIQGSGITKSFNYNIFESAKSVDFVFGPSKNAFSSYDQILDKAKKIERSRLILIILGPTATVLAFDLARLGFNVLDIGHTAKDYDFFKKNIERNSINLRKFYAAD